MVQRTVKRFVDQELRPLEREVEEADRIAPEVDRALRKKSVELGFYGHNLPEEAGGGGLSTLGQALIGEELGRTTMALASTVGFLPGGLRFAKPKQRRGFSIRSCAAIRSWPTRSPSPTPALTCSALPPGRAARMAAGS